MGGRESVGWMGVRESAERCGQNAEGYGRNAGRENADHLNYLKLFGGHFEIRKTRGCFEVARGWSTNCSMILGPRDRSKVLRESLKITIESYTRKISLGPQKKSERARNNPPENR